MFVVEVTHRFVLELGFASMVTVVFCNTYYIMVHGLGFLLLHRGAKTPHALFRCSTTSKATGTQKEERILPYSLFTEAIC